MAVAKLALALAAVVCLCLCAVQGVPLKGLDALHGLPDAQNFNFDDEVDFHVSVQDEDLSAPGRNLRAAKAPALTTNNDPRIVDQNGKQVKMRGIAWFGFNDLPRTFGDIASGNAGSINQDIRTVAYRMHMLGFNAIRLAFSFDHLSQPAAQITKPCQVTSAAQLAASITPPGKHWNYRHIMAKPGNAPPKVVGGICNRGVPQNTAYNQFVWAAQYLMSRGFYVALDFHSSILYQPQYNVDNTPYNPNLFIAKWKKLIKDVTKNKATRGKLLIDLMNEPDGYSFCWDRKYKGIQMSSYYASMIANLYPVCKTCLFLVEGMGQSYHWTSWGDGFTPHFKGRFAGSYNYKPITFVNGNGVAADGTHVHMCNSDVFFQKIHNAKWRKQVVLSPHFYCPSITGAMDHYAGAGFLMKEDNTVDENGSIGWATTTGYCYKGTCRKYAVLHGEFASNFKGAKEVHCMDFIRDYMNNAGAAVDHKHMAIHQWFFWSWNPNSHDTGGILGGADQNQGDFLNLNFQKIGYLQGLGLTPFYAQ